MKTLSSLDFLGTSPKLTIGAHNSNKTVFGGLLSILVASLLVTGSIYFIILLISRNSFSVLMSEEFYPNSFSDWTNNEISFILGDKLGQLLENDERIYTIVGTQWSYTKVNNSDGTVSSKTSLTFFKMEKCNVTKHFQRNPELWKKEKYITHSYCMSPDQMLNVSKPFGYDDSTFIIFWVLRCQNSTTKKDCYAREYLDKILENTFFLTRFTNYYFDDSKQGDTAIPYIHNDAYGLSSTVYKSFRYRMRSVQYDTDSGIYLPETVSNYYTTLDEYKESTDLRTDATIPDSFGLISFNMSLLKQKFSKRYYKFQNMLADLGGLLKV